MSIVIAAGGALDLSDPQGNAILQTFVAQAGGRQAHLLIVTIASAVPEQTTADYTAAFQALGASHITSLHLNQRSEAFHISLAAVQQATGIYLSGGNQLRFTSLVLGTPLAEALRAAHQRGAVFLGSSAGTAVLPPLMLAYGEDGAEPRQGMAALASGLGLVEGIILDQHFSQRGRLGRLLAAVANNPHLLGVGVDENTAVLIEGQHLRVLGQHGVTVVDGRHSTSNAADLEHGDPIHTHNMHLHHLRAGDKFNWV
ncbi:MAG: cyanophycinase [Chloroflexi bacterium]|nr:cyanophycinase [Chloroflexota bacterium]